MNWITFEGRFATENPDAFLELLEQVLSQTKTQFHGKIYNQKIRDIPCQKIVEPSTPMEVPKEKESSIKTDDCVNEADTPLSSFEEELL